MAIRRPLSGAPIVRRAGVLRIASGGSRKGHLPLPSRKTGWVQARLPLLSITAART